GYWLIHPRLHRERHRCGRSLWPQLEIGRMDITPTWTTMIRELALMASRGCQREEWAESFDFAIEELKRVGKFLDSLPKEEQPPLPKPQPFFAALRAMQEEELLAAMD